MCDLSYADHPKYKEILSCGMKDGNQLKVVFLVYIDLCEIHGWYDVQIHPCTEHNLMFLSGHPNREDLRILVLPLDSGHILSIEHINTVLQSVHIQDCSTNKVTMAVCDRDSSIVYYNLSQGIAPPDTPQKTEEKKQQRITASQRRNQEVTDNVNLFLESKRQKIEEIT
ncbi:hypothetical protein ScPMuIL_010236 [Solemya velum]